MQLQLAYKVLFEAVWKALNGVVGGKYEVKPNIWIECPTDLTWRLKKNGSDIVVEFPKSKVKVTAAKWMFQLDGTILSITIKKDKVLVEIENMPDLEIIFV